MALRDQAAGQDILRVSAIVTVTLSIGTLHYLLPDEWVQMHYLVQRLFYAPVVYAGLCFGWRGGLAAALLAGLAYLQQILSTWRLRHSDAVNQCAEVIFFCVAGIVAGLLADRERRQKQTLQDTAAQLSRVYGELQDNFERMKRAERLYALGQLSAGLAHEIRNPLAGIEGAAGVLLREPPGEERRVEFLEIIQKECRRLNRLLTNFLSFAKPRDPELSTVRIEQVLDKVVTLAEHAIRNNAIEFRTEVAEDVPELKCDPEQLTQILLNLTINAIQAMPEGGEISLSAQRRNDYAVIEVRDQGTGIKEEDLEKIFDPFFTTKEAGTGLGLPVAHQIAVRQGGVLSAARNADCGMTFCLKIPFSPEGVFR